MKSEAAGTADSSTAIDPHVFDEQTGTENMRQLIQLRWIAVVGQIITIAVVHFGFGINLPLQEMGVILVCLVIFNIGSMFRWQEHHEVTNGELFFALLVDVGTLTAQLYLSGGATNPFSFLYLVNIALAAVVLPTSWTWTLLGLAALSSGLFVVLTVVGLLAPWPAVIAALAGFLLRATAIRFGIGLPAYRY